MNWDPQRSGAFCEQLFGAESYLQIESKGDNEAKFVVTMRMRDLCDEQARRLFSEIGTALSQVPGTKETVFVSSVSKGVGGFLPLKPFAVEKVLESPGMIGKFDKFSIETLIQEKLARMPNLIVFDRCDFIENGDKLLKGKNLSVVFKEKSPPFESLCYAVERKVFVTLGLKDMNLRDDEQVGTLLMLVEAWKANDLAVIWNPDDKDDDADNSNKDTVALILQDVTVRNEKLVCVRVYLSASLGCNLALTKSCLPLSFRHRLSNCRALRNALLL